MSRTWRVIPGGLAWGDRRFVWGSRTYVMGILNVTPDSFSDGGRYLDPAAAEEHALAMAEAGADIIDVGAESTRPGAAPVPAEEELRRLLPVLRRLAPKLDVPISVDTYKAQVARVALEEGAALINDVGGLRRDPAMAAVAAAHRVPVVAMHARPHGDTAYADFWGEILGFLRAAIERAEAAGLPREMVIVDPGFGFGKTPEQNLDLIRQLPRLRTLGAPVLLGTSRKSTIGRVLDLPVDQRLEGTAATVVLAVARGVDVVRVHDVAPMVRLVRMADTVVRHPRWREGDEPAPVQDAARPDPAAAGAGADPDVPRPTGRLDPTPAPPARSVIQLRALRFEARHGVLPEEHRNPQPFLVDVDLGLDTAAAAAADDLALTVDYAEVHRRVARVVEGPHRRLIETLAHQLAAELLHAFPVDWVRVRVAKPAAPLPGPAEGAAVEVWRSRAGRVGTG